MRRREEYEAKVDARRAAAVARAAERDEGEYDEDAERHEDSSGEELERSTDKLQRETWDEMMEFDLERHDISREQKVVDAERRGVRRKRAAHIESMAQQTGKVSR